MGYWLLIIFLAAFSLLQGSYSDNGLTAQRAENQSISTQQAAMVIDYLNAINDYLYSNPMVNGVVPDAALNISLPAHASVRNVVQDGRVMVYLPETPGLVSALRRLSRNSALLCRASQGVLTDLSGNATGISAPSGITGSDLVYLN
ncbi:type IV pilus biogenesis protein PilM [Lelliottia aquatilis]|uniref:type IV pilus biogenesis protein PilM n=1 Tax=Lelliottia aquatilis TaxID=2080838 RepID=UPI0015765EE2|nr:type IV pilus biogenesis protein PilM [Lelliottia aquatilis]